MADVSWRPEDYDRLQADIALVRREKMEAVRAGEFEKAGRLLAREDVIVATRDERFPPRPPYLLVVLGGDSSPERTRLLGSYENLAWADIAIHVPDQGFATCFKHRDMADPTQAEVRVIRAGQASISAMWLRLSALEGAGQAIAGLRTALTALEEVVTASAPGATSRGIATDAIRRVAHDIGVEEDPC